MKYVLSLLVFYWMGSLYAQEAWLEGYVEQGSPGTPVRVQTFADPYSGLLQTHVSSKLDGHGHFSVKVPLRHPQKAFLVVGLQKGTFFIQPGHHYSLRVLYDSLARVGSIFDRKPLMLAIESPTDVLNDDFSRFNKLYDNFLIRHFNDLYRYRRPEVLKTFEDEIKQWFPNDTLRYFRQSVRYRLASLQWSARLRSNAAVFQEVFLKSDANLFNEEFAQFFTDFIENYVAEQIRGPISKPGLLAVVPMRNWKAFDKLFASDDLLAKNKKVRILAEMVVIKKYYGDNDFLKSDFDALLTYLSQKGEYDDLRAVASHYLLKLHQMAPGTVAPAFQLPDAMGKEYHLADFQSKFVLVSFFKTDCPLCLRDLDLLEKMQQNLGSNFTHLTILMGKPDTVWLQKILSGRFTWPFLLLGNQLPLLEKYQVRSFPAYVLLAPGGKVAMAPAPMPAEGAGERISRFISRYMNKHRTGRSP